MPVLTVPTDVQFSYNNSGLLNIIQVSEIYSLHSAQGASTNEK